MLGGDSPSGEADKLSFDHFGFLSCLCQRLNESVCVLINDKRSDGIVKGPPESGWRPEQRVFKELGGRPDSGSEIAHRERSDSGRFQLFGGGEEFGERPDNRHNCDT